MEINEDGIHIVGRCNNFLVGNIEIVKNFVKKLNYAVNFYNKLKVLDANNYSREQKRSWLNTKNNFTIHLARFVKADKINSITRPNQEMKRIQRKLKNFIIHEISEKKSI